MRQRTHQQRVTELRRVTSPSARVHSHCSSVTRVLSTASSSKAAYLHFVRVSGDTKRFVSSCRHWAVLDHHHLHSGSLLTPQRHTVVIVLCILQMLIVHLVWSPSHLQLFDGVSSSTNHQPHLTGWDQHFLHCGPTLSFAVEPWTVSAALHDLDQQALSVPVNTRADRNTHTDTHTCRRRHEGGC